MGCARRVHRRVRRVVTGSWWSAAYRNAAVAPRKLLVLFLPPLLLAATAPAAAQDGHRGGDPPTTYTLFGDDTADGRVTAVGNATDHRGRVFVDLLAALRMPADGLVFLNDIIVGPDGAAHVTDSTTPRIFRIAREHGDRTATLWSDAAADVPHDAGTFGLNGIEVAPDGRSLIVAHSANGQLRRFDLRTAEPTLIDTGDADLMSSDGLVVKGRTLVAVRNARTSSPACG